MITVYNDRRFLGDNLLATLRRQTAQYEFIGIDNSAGTFASAAAALNRGAAQARGDYLIFAHQDMRFISPDTLARIEALMLSLPDAGIAGVIGVKETGETGGYIINTYEMLGARIDRPEEVQTLDECLLIVPRKIFALMPFDEKVTDGWHLYGVDYCLTARAAGLKTYVLPVLTHHFSLATNYAGLFDYQRRVFRKHYRLFPKIYTTCGKISRRALARAWFKNTFLNPWRRSHPRTFFHDIMAREDIRRILIVNPAGSMPAQSFPAKGKHLDFITARHLDGISPPYDAVILANLFPGREASAGRDILQAAERLGRHIYISHRIRRGIPSPLSRSDFARAGYMTKSYSKKWQIYEKAAPAR